MEFNVEGMAPERFPTSQWDSMVPYIASLSAAGYYISPVGEIDGDVYVEVEEEAVEMWRELVASR